MAKKMAGPLDLFTEYNAFNGIVQVGDFPLGVFICVAQGFAHYVWLCLVSGVYRFFGGNAFERLGIGFGFGAGFVCVDQCVVDFFSVDTG